MYYLLNLTLKSFLTIGIRPSFFSPSLSAFPAPLYLFLGLEREVALHSVFPALSLWNNCPTKGAELLRKGAVISAARTHLPNATPEPPATHPDTLILNWRRLGPPNVRDCPGTEIAGADTSARLLSSSGRITLVRSDLPPAGRFVRTSPFPFGRPILQDRANDASGGGRIGPRPRIRSGRR